MGATVSNAFDKEHNNMLLHLKEFQKNLADLVTRLTASSPEK